MFSKWLFLQGIINPWHVICHKKFLSYLLVSGVKCVSVKNETCSSLFPWIAKQNLSNFLEEQLLAYALQKKSTYFGISVLKYPAIWASDILHFQKKKCTEFYFQILIFFILKKLILNNVQSLGEIIPSISNSNKHFDM